MTSGLIHAYVAKLAEDMATGLVTVSNQLFHE